MSAGSDTLSATASKCLRLRAPSPRAPDSRGSNASSPSGRQRFRGARSAAPRLSPARQASREFRRRAPRSLSRAGLAARPSTQGRPPSPFSRRRRHLPQNRLVHREPRELAEIDLQRVFAFAVFHATSCRTLSPPVHASSSSVNFINSPASLYA